MKLYGITGAIGGGKSTSTELLRKRGLPVIDTDTIARDIVLPGQPALEEIRTVFGETMIGADGALRRDELARKVFGDKQARETLEQILHPRIREIWQGQAAQWQREGREIGFVVIPLLFETNAATHFSKIICVACSEETQRERLRARGWSEEQLQQRINAQWPTQKKMDASDFVIWTETTLEIHAAQLDKILGNGK